MAAKSDVGVLLCESSKQSAFSVVCKLEFPNVVIPPECLSSFFERRCPSFEFASGTFCFKCVFREGYYDDDRNHDIYFSFYMMLESETFKNEIFYNVILFGTDGKRKKENSGSACFKEDEEEILYYYFPPLKHGKLGTLTLTVQLFCNKSTEEDAYLYHLPVMDKDAEILSEDYKKLLLNGKNYDFTLTVADKEFRVHRDILMARSPVFHAMLTHEMKEKEERVIDVPDSCPEVMEQFLLYVYSGKVETLSRDNALGLYYAADKYNFPLLKGQCTEFIKKSLSPSIICDVVNLALTHSDSDLLQCATEYFLDHTCEIFATLQWMSFMKTNSVAANELLLKASKKWSAAK